MVIMDSQRHWRQLFTDGYALTSVDETPLAGLTYTPEWAAFVASYENLPRDEFMADGGRYRHRRYSEFRCDGETGRITKLPHAAYEQSRDINKLNGGVNRIFAPLEDVVAEGEIVRELLGWASRMLGTFTGRPVWNVQCFQNQTIARRDEVGQPTPEGVHRDGVDFVLTLLVERRNIIGGVSAIYVADRPDRPAIEVELDVPGQLLLNDDTRMLHGVTPVRPATGDYGVRNIFNALFTTDPQG